MSAIERELLAAVLDTLIPPHAERGMPGAGSLGIEEAVESALDDDQRRSLGSLVGFASLGPADRAGRLRELDEQQPGVIATLHFHVMEQYYQHPAVVAALGVESHPPFPAGFTLERGKLEGLDRVRARGRLYREP